MKTTIKLLSALAAVGLGLNASASDLTDSAYVNANVGPSFQSDITSTTTGAKISFDPGYRMGVSVGYHITNPLAVEFETGVAWNRIDEVGGASISSANTTVDWYQIPLLVNAVYYIPLDSQFKPFIGGGLGGVVSEVNYRSPSLSADDSDVIFGYQAMVGFKYEINSQMDVGFAYKYLGTTDHDFGILRGLNDSTSNHSLLASFTYRF